MSVGANSIKRAAKTANTKAGEKVAVSEQEESVKKVPEDKVGSAAKKPEKAAEKKTEKAAEKKPKKTAAKASEKATAGESKTGKPSKETAKQGHEAYGIGQQLPVHLL